MRQHMLLPGKPPVVVAAHSIGAYVGIHAVRDVELDKHIAGFRPPILKVKFICMPEISAI